MQWDWYPVLGNHDYGGNPDAQVAYSKISRRWRMPARYYTKTFQIDGGNEVLVAFIDTNPLIPDFYKNKDYGPNVISQDSTAQKKWLDKVLSTTSPKVKWKFNVPYGRYANFNTSLVTIAHSQLLANTEIYNLDYKDIFKMAKEDDFMFLDPPYDCIFSDYGNAEYKDGFNETNHIALAKAYKQLKCKALMVINLSGVISPPGIRGTTE